MKPAVAIVFSLLCATLFGVPMPLAEAQTPEYGRAVSETTVLYKTPVKHYDYALFYLPYSYYVRIVDKEGDFYLVEYQDNEQGYPKIYGFVAVDDLSLENQSPSAPIYKKQTLTLVRSSYIYTRAGDSDILASVLKDQTVRFYGRFCSKDGENLYYYVRFGQVMGYLPAECCSSPKEDLHPDPVVEPSAQPVFSPSVTPSVSEKTEQPLSSKDSLRILLIVVVTVAVLVCIYTMFRPQKREQDRYFDDE